MYYITNTPGYPNTAMQPWQLELNTHFHTNIRMHTYYWHLHTDVYTFLKKHPRTHTHTP